MGTPHVGHVTVPLWEMSLDGRDGIARALHVAGIERRVVVVRVFVKKTRRTPRREIEVARALIEARTRAGFTQAEVHPGGVGGSDADDTIGGGTDGEGTGAAVDADAGEARASDGYSFANQLRAGVRRT